MSEILYDATAKELVKRIKSCGREILKIENAWDLFKLPGFECEDIAPSLHQAMWALRKAQQELQSEGDRP